MRARHCGCQNGSRWERAVETVVLSSKKKEREKQKRINKKRNDGWSISPSGIENWRNQILIECRCAIAFQHFVRFNFVKSERFPRGQELLTVFFFSLSLLLQLHSCLRVVRLMSPKWCKEFQICTRFIPETKDETEDKKKRIRALNFGIDWKILA